MDKLLLNKKIAILIDKEYQELEVWYPYYRFKEEGAKSILIGPEKDKEYPSKCGYLAESELGIKDALNSDFDAVIIPGGWAPDYMRRNRKIVEFIKSMNDSGKIIAAICHGGWLLCSANIIKGRKVTGFFAIADDLKNAGGMYVDREVVVDGNIITSRKPDDLPAFCREIINSIGSRNGEIR